MTRPRVIYQINVQRQIVQGIFEHLGKRVYRRLCTFEEAHISPAGDRLPHWTDAQRDAFLNPLWLAMRDALAVLAARHGASGLIAPLWQDFITAAAADRAPGTLALYRAARADYLAANENHPLSAFTLHHVDRFKARCIALKHAPHTINQRLNALRAFLRWAHERQELDQRPVFKNVPAPRRQPSVLNSQQLQALLARIARLMHAGDKHQRRRYRHHLRFLMLGLGCGLRRGEILNLRWDHVDLDGALITVRITRQFRTKEHREKTVPMPDFLQGFLRHEHRTKPKGELWLLDNGKGERAYGGTHGAHSLTTAFRKHLAAIGAAGKGVKPTHGQRALFATELHRRGVDAYTIQQLMGHSSITVTEHYLADPSTAKRRAIGTLALPRRAATPNNPQTG